MRRERTAVGAERVLRAESALPVWISAASFLLLMLAFHGVTEASWSRLEGHAQMLAGVLAYEIVEQVIGRGVTLLVAVVAVIVGLPLVLASLALAAGYIASLLRPLRRSS